MEVEEKADVDLTAAGADVWANSPGGGASGGRREPAKDSASARAAGDAVAPSDGGEAAADPGSPRPGPERNNTASVIVRVEGSGGAVRPAAEVSGAAAEHPGKVIVTDVTINALTVTFKEATMAEGFFKGY